MTTDNTRRRDEVFAKYLAEYEADPLLKKGDAYAAAHASTEQQLEEEFLVETHNYLYKQGGIFAERPKNSWDEAISKAYKRRQLIEAYYA